VQSLHGTMYHLLGIRRWIHTRRFKGDVTKAVELRVDLFLRGAERLFESSVPEPRQNGSIKGQTRDARPAH